MTAPVELSIIAQHRGEHPAAMFTILTRLGVRGEKIGRVWYFEKDDVDSALAARAREAAVTSSQA